MSLRSVVEGQNLPRALKPNRYQLARPRVGADGHTPHGARLNKPVRDGTTLTGATRTTSFSGWKGPHMNVSLETLALLLECKAEREDRADLEALLLEAREWGGAALRFAVELAARRLEVDVD